MSLSTMAMLFGASYHLFAIGAASRDQLCRPHRQVIDLHFSCSLALRTENSDSESIAFETEGLGQGCPKYSREPIVSTLRNWWAIGE